MAIPQRQEMRLESKRPEQGGWRAFAMVLRPSGTWEVLSGAQHWTRHTEPYSRGSALSLSSWETLVKWLPLSGS